MGTERLFERYLELQAYVRWTDDDARRIQAVGGLLEPYLPGLTDDFFTRIESHPRAIHVITGDQTQIDRLKGTLLRWLRERLAGQYDAAYVDRRWWVGWRHVEIGLGQSYAIAALSRLRSGLVRCLQLDWKGGLKHLNLTASSLISKLLDMDLAIIEEAYQAEDALRLQRADRVTTLGQVAGGVAHELRNPLS